MVVDSSCSSVRARPTARSKVIQSPDKGWIDKHDSVCVCAMMTLVWNLKLCFPNSFLGPGLLPPPIPWAACSLESYPIFLTQMEIKTWNQKLFHCLQVSWAKQEQWPGNQRVWTHILPVLWTWPWFAENHLSHQTLHIHVFVKRAEESEPHGLLCSLSLSMACAFILDKWHAKQSHRLSPTPL